MVNTSVLVLNRFYLAVNVTSVRRAFCLLYEGLARAVDEQFRTFDFESWSALAVALGDDSIGLVDRAIRVPRVIVLLAYDRFPKRHVRFSRANIYSRDRNTCQYCGRGFSRSDLNLDHVVPRSRGGLSSWENIVCCCLHCNKRKGGKTPVEAGMRLLRPPRKPRWTPLLHVALNPARYREWLPFLNAVDLAYWNTELVE
ncbi:MAG: HNH endonuclease [Deltaproteobacteria bacterium]|nr:HNH endonuclease [Deltaproteobacteria bacterium]MBI3075478.1 HNH endonuclease [Deltaproteobacteria bacterium]